MSQTLPAAQRLHAYLLRHCWRDDALIGPDPGVRFNYRLFRFIKSYLRFFPWQDDLYYAQAQGYWMLANVLLHEQSDDSAPLAVAQACARTLIRHQRDDGAWEYPNPEWKGRIATAEGSWGALGLLALYRHTGEAHLLDAARRWQRYIMDEIGFQEVDGTLAVNYFAHRPAGRVPNNSAFVLRFLAEFADVTGDASVLEPCAPMLAFMRDVQTPEGEFPYQVPGPNGGDDMPHFQCTQYNAFQCLDLMRYHELTGDDAARDVIAGVLRFLATRQAPAGYAHYQCGQPEHTVVYHSAVLAATFRAAEQMGFTGYAAQAERGYAYVLGKQRRDGSFPHSFGDYGLLSDQRAYPRYLAMILTHLLQAA